MSDTKPQISPLAKLLLKILVFACALAIAFAIGTPRPVNLDLNKKSRSFLPEAIDAGLGTTQGVLSAGDTNKNSYGTGANRAVEDRPFR